MDPKFKTAIEAIELCIEDLYDQAHATCDGYINFVDAVESKSTGWESRSNLQLSCTKKGNHLDIRWVGIKWYGQKNKRTSLRVTLKKHPEKLSYGSDQFKPFAKEWEIEKVVETEKILALIRRKNKHLVRSIMSIRAATKIDAANPTADAIEEMESD
ncbi:MAG: conjugative transfer protein MobI(A/C) [Pseudomonadota bacterium]